MSIRWLQPLLMFACVAITQAAEMPIARQRELLQSGLSAFDEAVAATNEPSRAAEHYRRAASAFEALMESGVRSSALEYNLGNTYFRLHDIGRSILHYRRALRLDPSNARAAANLAYVRERVEPIIAPTGSAQFLERVWFWNRAVSYNGRFWIAAFGALFGWGALLVWLKRRARPFAWIGVALVALGMANAASAIQEMRAEQTNPDAVVSVPRAVLRQGRGEQYEAVLKQPLGAGVEVRILTPRGDWAEVRLANDQTGWLPLAAMMRVSDD